MLQRKVYKVIERNAANVPIDEILIDGSLDIYDDVLQKNYFAILLKGNKLSLTAGNFIGLIPLNARVALLVEPKVSRDNWLYIVGRARKQLHELIYLRKYSKADFISQSLVEFLARAFLIQLSAIEERGLYRQYQAAQEITSFPRGKILFGETILKAFSRGHTQSLAVEYYIFSKDTAHNRLLKYALELASKYLTSLSNLTSLSTQKSHLITRLRNLEEIFKSIPLDPSLKYLPVVQVSLEKSTIPDTRDYYDEICRTALLIVAQSGLMPTLRGDETTLSFVVNMEDTFQNYCFNLLKDESNVLGANVLVQQEPMGSKPLFTGLNCDPRRAQPDIIIKNLSGPQLILEVKYKNKPNREDINQAITYAVAYHQKKVALLCYAEEDSQSGWKFIGRAGENIDVWLYRINLETSDLQKEEQLFITSISKMLNDEILP